MVVSDIKLSTVVPASITGEDKIQELSDLDLAFKLHYITTVHFFDGDAAAGLSVHDLKKPMFQWLQLYYPICGRLRRHDDAGRPYIKCNDSGVRIVEANAGVTLDECLHSAAADHHRLLVYHLPILAQDFGFTPLVFLQLTKFKCGGLSVGMRWAHILGDAFSALECINMWGKMMADKAAPPQLPVAPNHHHSLHGRRDSTSAVTQLESVGDNWLVPTNSKMQTHTLHITDHQLTTLLSRDKNISPFQMISALIWKSMANIKGTKIVTLCENKNLDDHKDELPSNGHQVIGVVEAETTSQITDADPLEIAKFIAENFVDQTGMIQGKMEEGDGILDFVVYGSNLTFLNLEGVDVYGLQLKGRRPVFSSISVLGVADEGTVVVAADAGGGGRVVNLILPQDQLDQLKNELKVDWGIV